jgi:hypothetical protein
MGATNKECKAMERVKVWVTRFADRRALQLQWIDPETGAKRTKSARTSNEGKAEQARAFTT